MTAITLFAVASASGSAGGEPPAGWKPFLAPDDFQELTKRSLERLHALAKESKSSAALRAEALILAGYTISTKDAPAWANLRQKALKVATLAANKDTADEARKLAADLSAAKGGPKSGGKPIDWPTAIGDIGDLMTPLANKAKGGDGIAADLQYTAKLKSQNGIEALLVALANKKISATSAGKLSKELELVSYRVATIGALTRRRGPHKNKDDAKLWEEQSALMRDAAVELAEAAEKKEVAAIYTASRRLVGTCVTCHDAFPK
jgi:hypothetical protein